MRKEFLRKGHYYRVFNKDGTSYEGFKNSTKKGGITVAPDWNPDPGIDCGNGLHVVEGHPFVIFEIISRDNPIYFEVEPFPNPPVRSFWSGMKFRCQRVINLRCLNKRSPEFNQDFLVQIAEKEYNYYVRIEAIKMLDSDKHEETLAQFAQNDFCDKVRMAAIRKLNSDKHGKFLNWIARNDCINDVRIVAIQKLDHGEYEESLIWLAKCDYKNDVRIAAIRKLNPDKHGKILTWISKNDCDDTVRRAAWDELKKIK